MSRVQRLLVTDRIFFVTTNLHKGFAPLAESEFPLVVESIEKSRQKLGFMLCGYVLMPDHLHALFAVRDSLTISRAVQDTKWLSARILNRRRKTAGVVWQHQFWDRFVRHQKELSDRLFYMHWNPVRDGFVRRPGDWKWSSYNNFALDKAIVAACPIRIDYVQMPA